MPIFEIILIYTHTHTHTQIIAGVNSNKCNILHRNNAFKEDEGAWKGEGDGKVVNNQPQRVMMDGQGVMASGYVGR